MRVRLWIQQRHELPCASRKFQGIGCAMIGGEGDGVSNWTSSGVFCERSIEDEEVSLVDGVLDGALGALVYLEAARWADWVMGNAGSTILYDKDLHCVTYGIPTDLRPELPDRNGIIKDSPSGKIGMYTRFVEFANFYIPLLKFLLCVLEYYQINLSQLSIIGVAKISHFELMCHAVGSVPTIGTFCRFYVNSLRNGWLSFSKRSGADDPCCVSKKFDSLKNWNNYFFWIDVAVFPLSIPWFDGVSIVKYPLPVEDVVDLLFAPFMKKQLFTMYADSNFYMIDDEETGLLDFVKSADPFKVKTGERTLAKDEVPLLMETKGRVISPSADIISLVDHTIQDELKAHGVKKKKRVAFVAGSTHLIRVGEEEEMLGSVYPASYRSDEVRGTSAPELEVLVWGALHVPGGDTRTLSLLPVRVLQR
ncbi:hypothetical protein Tco_1493424 [Tanacetum coccineum]